MSKSQRYIGPSEIREYVYCPRSWWLRNVMQVKPKSREVTVRLEQGKRFHEDHGNAVVASRTSSNMGMSVLAVAAALLVVWFCFSR